MSLVTRFKQLLGMDGQHEVKLDLRVALGVEDFRALVSGGEITRPGLKLILSDIGFDVMRAEVERAEWEQLERRRRRQR